MIDEIDQARSALSYLDPGEPRPIWLQGLMAAKAAGLDLDDVICWSRNAANFRSDRDVAAVWRSIRADGPITAATLFKMARDAGWRPDNAPASNVQPRRRLTVCADDERRVADQRKRKQAAEIWRSASQIQPETIGAEYLLGRGCLLPPIDGDLRWLPDLRLFGFSGPALVGRVSEAVCGRRGIGLHLTWLQRDGGYWKRVERRYLGRKAGGVVRLWPDDCVTHGLSIAEGVETALAAAHVGPPVWACLDAGNLASFPVLDGIDCLTIFADHDASGTGFRSAADCADRWTDAGREVFVLASDVVGHDVVDELEAPAC